MSAVTTPTYNLRYMTLDDIPQVSEVDKVSFPLPWSVRSYVFEIRDNATSHMIVVEDTTSTDFGNRLMTMLRRLQGRSARPPIAGYGGFWLIDGEAHVSTIAVHPAYRGRGLGELLLAGMIKRSLTFNAEYSVLEVRVSNKNAITLYYKYEYEKVGERKNYYRDNNENAFLMHVLFSEKYRTRFEQRFEKLRQRLMFTDQVTHAVNGKSG